jgi:hypothetical protein
MEIEERPPIGVRVSSHAIASVVGARSRSRRSVGRGPRRARGKVLLELVEAALEPVGAP